MNDYRVFISYSHNQEDALLAEKVFSILENNGLSPMYDKNFAWGHGFPEQIKNCISHSHVFIPIISENSIKRGWVHQEIGYAMALKIPVLPIACNIDPGEMLSGLQAIKWEGNENQLREQLSPDTFHSIVMRAQRKTRPFFECAEYHIIRTKMMRDYSNNILEMGERGHVRQMGALSSFHVPVHPVTDPIWSVRYGDEKPDDYKCELLRGERQALEEHARKEGCSLIIDPSLTYEAYGERARKVRLNSLLEFLESMPDDKVKIVTKKMNKNRSLTIVGDWFYAESISASIGRGYQNTIFTKHAPTINNRIELFDQEFNLQLKEKNLEPDKTRENVIEEIKNIMAKIVA